MSLKTIRLGKTGLQITQLGFGGIPIQRLTEDQAVAIVKRCVELGITFYDTATGYSTSEERIGKAIAGQREKVVIATKTPPLPREKLENNLKLSLTRLGTDYIDLYQFHGVSSFQALDFVLSPGGPLDVFKEAKKAGLIRHIGITSHQIDVAKKAVESDQFESVLFPFNFLSPEVEEKLLPACRAHDVGFIVMKPLAGGMVDNATICFKFLLQFPDVAIIPGIERIAEIEEIYRIVQNPSPLTSAEKAEMERIKKELGTSFCHRCDYCQPCPEKIPISTIMCSNSFYKRLPAESFFGYMVSPAMEKAENCQECGQCEERCPYHLPIRKMVKDQRTWFKALKKEYLERCQKEGK